MDRSARVAAAVDTAWSLAILGAIAYYLRAEIGRQLATMQREANRRRVVVEDAAARDASRKGFLSYLYAHGIEPGKHDLGMEP